MSSRDLANLKNGLVAAWIPSLGATGYRLVDRVGSNHGVLTNMDAASDWVVSNNNLALDFDGSNDFGDVSATAFLGGSGSVTLSAFAYAKTLVLPAHCILTKMQVANDQVAYAIAVLSDGRFYFLTTTGSGFGVQEWLSTSSVVSVNTWYHLAFTYTWGSGASLRAYVNGLDTAGSWATGNGNVTFTGTTALPIRFGRLQHTGVNTFFSWNGILDDIRIYNRALSATEVSLLSKERGIGFKTNSRTSSVFAKRYSYKPPKDKTYAAITRSQSDYDSLREGLVLAICPSVSGATGYRAVDVSGRGNHGSLVNMDAASDWVASNGMALDFDGNDDQIEIGVPSGYPKGTPLTLSAWVRLSASHTGGVIDIGGENGAVVHCFALVVVSGKAWALSQNNANNQAISTTTLSNNIWYHLTAVFNSATDRQIYVNGVSENTNTTSTIPDGAFFQRIRIGQRSANATDQNFNGQLDDVRLYNRALTPSEIRQLASKRGIGLQPRPKQFTYYQFPSGSKRRRILTGMT